MTEKKILPEKYDAKTREKHWQNHWKNAGTFDFKNDQPKSETFVIDTPPPTVSGLLHMGHVFSYTQADFVARFQRMSGKDVFYPMGFDDNGLPTERLVEKIIGKKAGIYEAENGHGSFVKKCREEVEAAETEFEALFNSIALSVDWKEKYQTISPESQKISQASFVDLYRKGLVEKKFEPVFWDISDRTALAQADLIDKEVEGVMNYIEFEVEDERGQTPRGLTPSSITIMTTRPELLPACVAVMVHPDDERYKNLHGKNAITPIFGVKVKIIADEDVQTDKGTGAVMCCTFGDETDIRWWKRHNLELRVIIERGGKFNDFVGNWGENFCNQTFHIDDLQIINIDAKHLTNPSVFREKYNNLVANKTIKQAKDAIIEALKNTQSNYPPLEGGSESEAIRGGVVNVTRFYSQETLQKAKELRKTTTEAENLLWHYLQNKQLGGFKFRKQQPFDKYIVDFVCLEKKLIIELDGSQHGEEKSKKYDDQRSEFLNQAGFRVLRFWNEEIFKNVNDVLESIFCNLNFDSSPKSQATSTLPQGEGGNQSVLKKQEKITRAVKCAERSGVPIEILVVPQWFIKILDKKELLKAKAAQCNWYPDYMKVRIDQWIDGLQWDWCISRQRFFGVKFPIWYSKRIGEEGKILVADIDQLPCDPEVDLPRGYSRDEVQAENDIMDTWATSSISPQLSSKGISDEIFFDKARHEKLFPADLRPQAHEIIRTWAFYTIVKAALHALPLPSDNINQSNNSISTPHQTLLTPHPSPLPQGERESRGIPWKNLMISGWCLAADKTKMSKSKGNVVTPTALIEEKGSDIVRYWASTSHLGADTAYLEEVFKIGQKLVTKLFNAAKFASMNFSILNYSLLEGESVSVSEPVGGQEVVNETFSNSSSSTLPQGQGNRSAITEASDLWILSRLYQTVEKATNEFNQFEYARAREAIEQFFWHDFCDNYLEICKVRSYGIAAEKWSNIELNKEKKEEILRGQKSAVLTLSVCLNTLLKLFAPFIPHICDEIYSVIFAEEFAEKKSINARGNWPKLSEKFFNQKYLEIGDAVLAVIFEVRKFKSEKNISMKTTVKKLSINSQKDLSEFADDLKNVCNAEELELFGYGNVEKLVEVIL